MVNGGEVYISSVPVLMTMTSQFKKGEENHESERV